ncbi:MAG: hypothetical protein H6806_09410 [Planctomycetes bacterium]|nr:hypothetical protein [Planctomycetota bacterium]
MRRRAAGANAILLLDGQTGIQRHHIDGAQVLLGQVGADFGDLSRRGQEHEDVAGALVQQLANRRGHGPLELDRVAVLVGARRTPAHLHGIGAPGDFDHGGAVEVLRKALGVERGRRDDHAEVIASLDETSHVAQEEVDVEAALMRFVEQDRVVGQEIRIAPRCREQDAVGHHLDPAGGGRRVVEAHGVAHRLGAVGTQLLRNAACHAPRRDAPRLRMADPSGEAATGSQGELGQLGRLAGPGLATHDEHALAPEQVDQLVGVRGNG